MALQALRRHWPVALTLGGGLVLVESAHGALSNLLSLTAAAGGLWLLSSRMRPSGRQLPTTPQGWIERCEAVLDSFERLQAPLEGSSAPALPAAEVQEDPAQQQRRCQLKQLRERQQQAHLQLALVGSGAWSDALQSALLSHCRSSLPLRVHRSHPLPASSDHWIWPEQFSQADLLIYRLDLPLKAADLRWLEALPEGLRVALLVDRPSSGDWCEWDRQLSQQLPPRLRQHCWPWSPEQEADLAGDLAPLAALLAACGPAQRRETQQRCLRDLHASWQVQLEGLRRQHWQQLLQRTQWTVAAGVVVAPLPSLDLVVLAAANGLMLQEMARLWETPWSLEQLQAAAAHLGKAALSLGVVEWSGQALASLVKLHGATWLVGSAMQALSAAYLTRVVGRAMADYMALAAGVPEQELEALLQRQAPLLVARAAEEEKLNWSAFLQQGRNWLMQQPAETAALQATS